MAERTSFTDAKPGDRVSLSVTIGFATPAASFALLDPKEPEIVSAQQVSTPSSSGVEKIEELGFRTSHLSPACPADCADHPAQHSDGEG